MATTGPIDLHPQLTRTGSAQAAATPRTGHSRARRMVTYVLFGLAILVIWESVKFVGGVPWRFKNVLGTDIDIEHIPPFRWAFASDLNLPHWFNILAALAAPVQRNAEASLAQFLVGAAFYTWREAVIGFIVGALLGLLLATVFVHSRLAERALVPYVVASQTIPIVALAPMIVFAFGPNVTSVVVIATYLTFFPVTIAMIVGAIIGEGPGGIPNGLGRAFINFNQQYITGPEKLWAAILVASLLGVTFFVMIRALELVALRGRPGAAEG